MNTFLTQAKVEVQSESFQAEAKIALQFALKLAKVIFLILVGLGLSTYIAGVRGKRFFNYVKGLYFPSAAEEYINVVFEDNIKVAKVLMQVKYYKVHSTIFLKATCSKLVTSLQPVISFIKRLSNGKSAT
jgi:hypothetical protein